jgi:two-component system, chemotaxis family, CheB/CheR fusion protein
MVPNLVIEKTIDMKKPSSILLIDHDVVCHILVSEALKGRGVELVHADNGRGAVNLFKYNPFFDLVITELLLPDTNGFGVLAEIRKCNPIIPVIALTSCLGSDLKQRCLNEGFNYFLEKPLSVDTIISNVETYKDYINI